MIRYFLVGPFRDLQFPDLPASPAARFPVLSTSGIVSANEGDACNTDSHICRRYNAAEFLADVAVGWLLVGTVPTLIYYPMSAESGVQKK